MNLIKEVKNLKETGQLAKWLAAKLNPGNIIALSGPLGSGKTTFIKALAKSLGIKSHVTSPTFLILKTYPVRAKKFFKKGIKKLVHVDVYRLESIKDLREVGFYGHLNKPGTILVIEWAEKIKKVLPERTIWIETRIVSESERVFKINFPNFKRQSISPL